MMGKTRLIGVKGLFAVVCLAVAAGTASAELVAKLPQVQNPFFLTIADGRMYIVENSVAAHIYVLEAKGASFIKTFGREGQGPGEFNFLYLIRVFKDHLDLPGSNKLARFSLDGVYISEVKLPIGAFKGGIYRLGDRYVARYVQFDDKDINTTVRLYDKDFKLIKELGARTDPGGFEKLNLVGNYFAPRVAGDYIYIVDAALESVVRIFDRDGVKQREIRLPLESIKMTAALKEAIIKPVKLRMSQDSMSRTISWEDYEKRLFFPDQTPGLDYFDVVEGKFVARTFKYHEEKVEFAVFDMEGRVLRRLDLPFTGRSSNGALYCFYQGRYYYLKENAEEEVWELHSEKVW